MQSRSNAYRSRQPWTLGLVITLLASTLALAADRPPRPGDHPHDGPPPAGPPPSNNSSNSSAPQPRSTGDAPTIKPEDISDVLAVLHDVRPDSVSKIEEALKVNPEGVRRTMNERLPWLTRLVRLRKEDTEAYKLGVQDVQLYQKRNELIQQIRSASDLPTVTKLNSDLKQTITDHFNVRQQMREHELKKLQDRVKQLQDQVDKVHQQIQDRSDSRDKVIDDEYRRAIDGTSNAAATRQSQPPP